MPPRQTLLNIFLTGNEEITTLGMCDDEKRSYTTAVMNLSCANMSQNNCLSKKKLMEIWKQKENIVTK